jgi:hypothetical protein
MNKEPYHQRAEEESTGASTKLSDPIGEMVEFDLQRCGFRVSLERHHETTIEALFPHRDAEVFSDPIGDLGTRDHEAVFLGLLAWGEGVAFGDALVVWRLLDEVRFTGGCCFICFAVGTPEEDTVARQDFTGSEGENVTDDDFLKDDE